MMDRRTFLTLGGVGAVGLASAMMGNVFGRSRDLPNVMLILVDSLNDWVSVLDNYPNAFTPNIERLAQRGVLFANAHTPGTISNGARTALFTGLHPTTTGIYNGNAYYRDFYPDIYTMSQYFMRLRYQVVGTGLLLHRPDVYSWQTERYTPPDGELVERQLSGVDFGPNFDWGALDVSETEMHDFKVAEWTCNYLETTSRTFFMGVGFNSTRPPWYLPRAEYQRFSPTSTILPDDRVGVLPPEATRLIESNFRHQVVLNNDQWAIAVSSYLSAMLFVDDMIGKILDTLEASPLNDNTIVILTSPHGVHLGSKSYWLYNTLWDDLTHVPLIMSVPDSDNTGGFINAGARVDSAVSLLDIYPTLLELIGVPALHSLDGRSLLPLLQQQDMAWDIPVVIAQSANEFAVRSNRWRYIRYAQGGEELYEHIGDPDELVNQANNPAHASLKSEFQALLPENPHPSREVIES